MKDFDISNSYYIEENIININIIYKINNKILKY